MEDYKEKLELARDWYNDQSTTKKEKVLLENLFPELKENEDERIKRILKKVLWDCNEGNAPMIGDKEVADCIAWLEKQGESKPIINVPPREVILSIWELGNEWKELTNGCISAEYGTQLNYIQKHWHESEYYLKEKQGDQKLLNNDKYQTVSVEILDRLYESEKELERLKQDEGLCKKSVWTGYDEKAYEIALLDIDKSPSITKNDTIDWLKSLKNRVQPQPKQEWSEKDENMLQKAISTIRYALSIPIGKENDPCFVGSSTISWLKSLKERYTWKPSDEQMEALLKLEEMHVLEHEKNQENAHLYMVIKSLREQLLKLKRI